MKTCTKCKKEKEGNEFHKRSDGISLSSWCKSCANEAARSKPSTYERKRQVGKTDADLFNQINKRW